MWIKWLYMAMGCMVMAMQALAEEKHLLNFSDEDTEFKILDEKEDEKSS